MYRTRLATQDEMTNWNNMISSCPYSEALHTRECRDAFADSFSQLEPLYFVITDDNGRIAGALPCFSFRPVPFSRTLLSMPWTLPGGPLIFPGADALEATLSVCRELDDIASERHSFETSFTLPPYCDNNISDSLISKGYDEKTSQFTHILSLKNRYDDVWADYHKTTRKNIRRAQKRGVTVYETDSEADLTCFYRLYLAQMKRFGSTPKPYSLLRYLQTSSIARIIVAEIDHQIVGGMLFLYFNFRVRLWILAWDREFMKCYPNTALYDYVVQWSCRHGCSLIDFGASPPGNAGLARHKEDWGAKKACFSTFTKLYSPWRKKLWTMSEPPLRRAYDAIQRLKIRNV